MLVPAVSSIDNGIGKCNLLAWHKETGVRPCWPGHPPYLAERGAHSFKQGETPLSRTRMLSLFIPIVYTSQAFFWYDLFLRDVTQLISDRVVMNQLIRV